MTVAERRPETESFELNGDARLQFWRDVYLLALPALLAKLPEGNVGAIHVLGIARLACDAADLAVAQHLARNDRDELNEIVDTLLAVPNPNDPK